MSDIEKQRRMRERAREQRKRELQTTRDDTLGVSPLGDNKVVSDNTKEALKTAGHWAGVIGKRAAELTQKGVVAAAEKAKEAKAQLDAKREKAAEERVQAAEAKSSTPRVQPVEVKATFAEIGAEDMVDALSVHEPAAIAGEGEAPVVHLSQQDVADALSVQSESDSLLFKAAETLANRGGAWSPSALLNVVNELDVGDARVTKASWGGAVNTDGLPPQEAQELIQSVRDDFIDEKRRVRERVREAYDVNGADEASTAPNVFTEPVETSSAEGEGFSQPPEAAPVEQLITPSQPSPRSRWPWLVGGVVAVALVAGVIYFQQEKNDQPAPSAPAPVAPVAVPVVPEQVPEVVEAPVVAPAPAGLPALARPEPTIEKPEPVVAPVVTDSARKEAQPKPSPQRAPATMPKKVRAPVSEPKSDWQQKANADLDAWAKKSGID